MKPAMFFCRNALVYHVSTAALAAVDLVLARIFGSGSVFFTYLSVFPFFFMMVHAVGVSNQCSMYARLALGFGATRRQLALGYTVSTFFSAGVATLLSTVSTAVTPLVLGSLAADTMQGAINGSGMMGSSILLTLVPMLGAGAAFGWVGILKSRKGWKSVLVIVLVAMLAVVLCMMMPLMIFIGMAIDSGEMSPIWNLLRWFPLAGGLALFAFFYALTVRELRRLTL